MFGPLGLAKTHTDPSTKPAEASEITVSEDRLREELYKQKVEILFIVIFFEVSFAGHYFPQTNISSYIQCFLFDRFKWFWHFIESVDWIPPDHILTFFSDFQTKWRESYDKVFQNIWAASGKQHFT